MDEGLKALWNLDMESIWNCEQYGRKLAMQLKHEKVSDKIDR
jgi:hypothetical protein